MGIDENNRSGYVYILSNQSMPNIYKIGRSKYGGEKRANQIYKNATGVPTIFNTEFEILVSDCIELESIVHKEMNKYRVNNSREFFKTDSVGELITCIINNYSQLELESYLVPGDFSLIDHQINRMSEKSGEHWIYSMSYISEFLSKNIEKVREEGSRLFDLKVASIKGDR